MRRTRSLLVSAAASVALAAVAALGPAQGATAVPTTPAVASVAATPAPSVAGHGGGHATTHRPVSVWDLLRLLALRASLSRYTTAPGGAWTTKVVDLQGISCIEDPAGSGTMGVHYLDAASLDGTPQARHPEALIYEPGTRQRIVAVEYLVIASAWDATHASPPRLYGQEFMRVAAGNRYGLPDFYELHVWLFRHNPNGFFADYNPRVQCA